VSKLLEDYACGQYPEDPMSGPARMGDADHRRRGDKNDAVPVMQLSALFGTTLDFDTTYGQGPGARV
jgi:hypothetical protein